jgi:hypothetical protein
MFAFLIQVCFQINFQFLKTSVLPAHLFLEIESCSIQFLIQVCITLHESDPPPTMPIQSQQQATKLLTCCTSCWHALLAADMLYTPASRERPPPTTPIQSHQQATTTSGQRQT